MHPLSDLTSCVCSRVWFESRVAHARRQLPFLLHPLYIASRLVRPLRPCFTFPCPPRTRLSTFPSRGLSLSSNSSHSRSAAPTNMRRSPNSLTDAPPTSLDRSLPLLARQGGLVVHCVKGPFSVCFSSICLSSLCSPRCTPLLDFVPLLSGFTALPRPLRPRAQSLASYYLQILVEHRRLSLRRRVACHRQ